MSQQINQPSSFTIKETAQHSPKRFNGVPMKKYLLSIAFILVLGWTMGCNNNAVNAPDQPSGQATVTGQNIQIIELPSPTDMTLMKKYRTGDWFTPGSDFELNVLAQFSTNSRFGNASFEASFNLPGNGLDVSQYITMMFNDNKMKVTFGPHGLQFAVPAILTYSATGVDLSSMPDGSEINLYYVNEESGLLEDMHTGTITYDKAMGTITCTGAAIPHFSEYAFGYIKK